MNRIFPIVGGVIVIDRRFEIYFGLVTIFKSKKLDLFYFDQSYACIIDQSNALKKVFNWWL
jgi:hypothetical protein